MEIYSLSDACLNYKWYYEKFIGKSFINKVSKKDYTCRQLLLVNTNNGKFTFLISDYPSPTIREDGLPYQLNKHFEQFMTLDDFILSYEI